MKKEQGGQEQRRRIDPRDARWCHFQAALRPRCIPVGGAESVSAALRLRRERGGSEVEQGERGRGGDAGKEGPNPARSCQSAAWLCGGTERRLETPHTRLHCKKYPYKQAMLFAWYYVIILKKRQKTTFSPQTHKCSEGTNKTPK